MDTISLNTASQMPLTEGEDASELRRFREEAMQGLRGTPKTLPCKYFYDECGSQLFDAITDLDEYYLTRTEMTIMEAHVGEMARRIGPGATLIEYGSGSGMKTRFLLDHLLDPRAYVPIDISGEHLMHSVERLRATYPSLEILPVCADYTTEFDLPLPDDAGRRVVYFPGSTLGNFSPDEALGFLKRIAGVCGEGGGLLIGIDLEKSDDVLIPAYNDREGLTAEFNLNLLRRLKCELRAEIDPEGFRHRAIYNRVEGRIEMHLVSLRPQTVHLDGVPIPFEEGETICTEYSYKYTPERFTRLAESAGFAVEEIWTDPEQWFSVWMLRA